MGGQVAAAPPTGRTVRRAAILARFCGLRQRKQRRRRQNGSANGHFKFSMGYRAALGGIGSLRRMDLISARLSSAVSILISTRVSRSPWEALCGV